MEKDGLIPQGEMFMGFGGDLVKTNQLQSPGIRDTSSIEYTGTIQWIVFSFVETSSQPQKNFCILYGFSSLPVW